MSFPPLQVVLRCNTRFSLSNRRLYVLRALHRLGHEAPARIQLLEWNSPGLLRLKWDPTKGHMDTKWNRAFSTRSAGLEVIVRGRGSRYNTIVNQEGTAQEARHPPPQGRH